MYTGEKQLEAKEVQAEIEKESVASRRDSVPLIFDHSYTERQSNLDRETKWLGDKARELHKKLAVLKRYQEDIEERTRILREKNLELMERNHQLAMGNRELQELVVEANSIRRDREEDLRRALEARDEFNWEDRVDDRQNSRDLPQHEP